jgi:uncharacterized protein YhfF
MPPGPAIAAFWREFLASVPNATDAAARFYESFRIGDTTDSADAGAALILSGVKTATSSLLLEYQASSKKRRSLVR